MPFEMQPTLVGDLIKLRPLNEDDLDALFNVAADPLIWQQHPANNRWEEVEFLRFFNESVQSRGALIAMDIDSGQAIGSSRYHGFSEATSEIEIGWTFLARRYWGGRYNGELKRLMLNHAFQYVDSVVLLVGPDNIRSQRAVEKIGGKRDGVRKDASGLESYLYRIRSTDWNPA